MTGQRKYWKSYAKSNLKGNWGIAIAAMLAVLLARPIISDSDIRLSFFKSLIGTTISVPGLTLKLLEPLAATDPFICTI